MLISFFFFNDTATTEIYTLSLHDALPIWVVGFRTKEGVQRYEAPGDALGLDLVDLEDLLLDGGGAGEVAVGPGDQAHRSEEHTSELQSRQYLVCRLLLEKKKNNKHI